MKIVLRIILLVAVLAVGFWLWTVLFPSPEKIVRKHLASLAHDVSFSADENGIIKMAHANSVADLFSSNVVINIDVPGHEQQTMTGRDQVTQAALVSRQQFTSLDVKFPDVDVTVAPDKNSATADVTAEVTISGEHDKIVQEFQFTFQKIDGQWLISEVKTVSPVS
jgi:SnoaL-like domain